MRNAYIKFHTDRDYEQISSDLLTHSPISRLSNGVFCIPWGSLEMLDAREVAYSFASEDDLMDARPIWNFALPPSR